MSRPTQCTVNLNTLKRNFGLIKQAVGDKKILVLVKADAYGHGICEVACALDEADMFGVATVEEGTVLRMQGIKTPVLCLGPIPQGSENECVLNGIEQAVSSVSELERLENACAVNAVYAGVHIKIETGMHRTGVRAGEELCTLLKALRECRHISLKGVFTHFAASDSPDEAYTHFQAENFRVALEQIKQSGFDGFITHCANSAAIKNFPEYSFDMVRAGIILYGYPPAGKTKKTIPVEPVLEWKTSVVALNEIKKGEKIGYSGTYTAPRDMIIAVLPVGYGDGWRRALSNVGYVLINGKRAPICGNICMDMTLVDVTDISGVSVGSEAVLIGKQADETVGADALAEKCGTISYEILTGITSRVPKIYIK